MKKLVLLLVVAMATGFCFAANPIYVDTTTSIAAAGTSVSVTNASTDGFVWTIADVYGFGSTGATDADTVTMYKALAAAPTVFYPVDTGTVASNAVNLRIDVDGVVQVNVGDVLKFVRTANSTNQVLKLLIVNEQEK